MTYLVCPLTKRPYILEEVYNEYCLNENFMTKKACEAEVCSFKKDIGFFSTIIHGFNSFFGIIDLRFDLDND